MEHAGEGTDSRSEDLPNMNSLKTQLPIAVQDPVTGKVIKMINAHTLVHITHYTLIIHNTLLMYV